MKQDRLAVLENHQHDPDAAKRVIADILRENQADAARRTHELVWSRIGDDNAAPAPAATKPRRRAPASIPTDPDALLTAAQAAAKLNATIEQVMAYVEDGSLRYVNIGRGSKRPRYRFTQSDLNEFIAARTQEHHLVRLHLSESKGVYWYDFQLQGHRFHGSTRCTTRREAEKYEAVERDKAKELIKAKRRSAASLAIDDVADRLWLAEGQHDAAPDATKPTSRG